MTRQIILRHAPSANRRQLLLVRSGQLSSRGTGGGGGRRAKFGEVAGGTAADCAAVCCCFPCTVVKFLVLTVYKLPAGLCRKALQQKRRRRLTKLGLLPPPQQSFRYGCGFDDAELQIHAVAVDVSPPADKVVKLMQSDEDVARLEMEMWDRFRGSGFWRSSSQRET